VSTFWVHPIIVDTPATNGICTYTSKCDSCSTDKLLLSRSVINWLVTEIYCNNSYIRVIEFWRLKLGFTRILRFNTRKCAWKVYFYKPCTLAASESECDHAYRILHLKRRRASLLYSVKVIKMSRLAIDRLLIPRPLHGSLPWPWNRLHNLSTLRRWERTIPIRPKLRRKLLAFLRAYLFAWWHLKSLSASDQNHTNTPNTFLEF